MLLDGFLWAEIDLLHRALVGFEVIDQEYVDAVQAEAEQMSLLQQNDYLNRLHQVVSAEMKARG